ncbi:hypothetical protein TNCV_2505251 [Trichonephila clavipes]|uniref:Uncharacterized protein n=1 Tax=Trichonephila clavipes TaxID=2585209 RepID=A0A8X6WFR6_TRICX|nr:hypothetical protein TNCV_2505251 [Trichonephila clavipes]
MAYHLDSDAYSFGLADSGTVLVRTVFSIPFYVSSFWFEKETSVVAGKDEGDIECLHAEIVEVEIEVVLPSIVPSGNFAELSELFSLSRTVTCMVLKANDRRTSCPCHDEFRGPRSDYVRQVALENNNKDISFF